MPRISEFYGIKIYLYYRDHPPPHVHAIYAQFEAKIEIGSGRMVRGHLPSRALGLVRFWVSRYKGELETAWCAAQEGRPPSQIPPLE